MKRTLALLLALLLGLSLLAGCGKDKPTDPDTPDVPANGEPIQFQYFSLTLEGGWIFYENSSDVKLKLGDDKSKVEMELSSYASKNLTPQVRLDKLLENHEDAVQAEETVTYGDIEYFVVDNTAAQYGHLYLISAQERTIIDKTWGEEPYVLEIELDGATLEQAAPVLETIKINPEKLEISHEWPESENVEMEHLTYTATGGWYLYNKFDKPFGRNTKGELKNDKLRPTATYMDIKSESRSPQYQIENDYGVRFMNKDAVQKDNVTINGIEWLVMEDAGKNKTILITSWRPGLLMDQDGSIVVEIRDVGIDGARPVLDTIKLTAEY